MEIKTIALDREAYDLLRKRKRKDESFSDAVKRIARETRPVSAFAGVWRKHLSDSDLETIEKIEKALCRGRAADRERTRKLLVRQG